MKALLVQHVRSGEAKVEVLHVTPDELSAIRAKRIKTHHHGGVCVNCGNGLVTSANVLQCRRCGYQEDRSFAA